MAVIQARLTPEVAAEILASERAVEVVRYGSSGVVAIRAGDISVYIRPTGIEVQSYRATRQTLQTLASAVEAQAGRMAVALATDKTAALLRSRYVVKADQTLANGARVLRITV